MYCPCRPSTRDMCCPCRPIHHCKQPINLLIFARFSGNWNVVDWSRIIFLFGLSLACQFSKIRLNHRVKWGESSHFSELSNNHTRYGHVERGEHSWRFTQCKKYSLHIPATHDGGPYWIVIVIQPSRSNTDINEDSYRMCSAEVYAAL